MKLAAEFVAKAKEGLAEVGIEETKCGLGAYDMIIDVREDDEFRAGHLPGAIHLSRGMIEFKISSNPSLQRPDAKILLYCKTGGRAALVARSLEAMGFLSLTSLAGGFDAWQQAGGQIQQPEMPSFT